MNFHPPKWLIYTGIGVFCFMLAAFLALVFSGQHEAVTRVLYRQQIQQAKELKHVADSIEQASKRKVDSIIQDKVEDSIHYVQEKRVLQKQYTAKQKSYDLKILAIDTMDGAQLNSEFSVRQMCSDSNPALRW